VRRAGIQQEPERTAAVQPYRKNDVVIVWLESRDGFLLDRGRTRH
jgi:hypothetical protein